MRNCICRDRGDAARRPPHPFRIFAGPPDSISHPPDSHLPHAPRCIFLHLPPFFLFMYNNKDNNMIYTTLGCMPCWAIITLLTNSLVTDQVHCVIASFMAAGALRGRFNDEMCFTTSLSYFLVDCALKLFMKKYDIVAHHVLTLILMLASILSPNIGLGSGAIPSFLLMEVSGFFVCWYARKKSPIRYLTLLTTYILNRVMYLTWLAYASPFSAAAAESQSGNISLATARVLHALMLLWFGRLLTRRPKNVTVRQLSTMFFLLPVVIAFRKKFFADAFLISTTFGTSLVIHRRRPNFPSDADWADVADPVLARLWAARCAALSLYFIVWEGIVSLCVVSVLFSITRVLPYNSQQRNIFHTLMHLSASIGSACVLNRI